MRFRWLGILPILFAAGCAMQTPPELPSSAPVTTVTKETIPHKETTPKGKEGSKNVEPIVKTDEEWKKELTPEQYHVLREKGTEYAFTGKYWNHHEDGTYTCAACGQVLFTSKEKFDSGCGWPSFFDAIDKSKVKFHDDDSLGMHRIEVMCSRCGGHLGHVFPDGPNPTGQRYCINSASINFKKAEEKP